MFERWRGSYFAKLVVSHLTLTFLLVTLGGGLLLNKTAALMTEELRAKGRTQLESFRERLEREQLASYNSALLNKALSTVRVEAESEIQYFLDHGKEGNYSRIERFTQDLKTLSMSMPTLHNLSFYFAKDRFVVDQFFYEHPERSPQKELLMSGTQIVTHEWFLRSVPESSGERVKVLTYVYALPYLAKEDQIKGYMIVDVDVQKLVASLGQHLEPNEERLAVLDDDGNVVAATAAWDESLLNAVRDQVSARGDGMIQHGDYVISTLPAFSSSFQWQYALVKPQDAVLLTTQKMKEEIWGAALLFLLLGGLVSYLISKYCYGTFRFILQRLRNVSGQMMHGQPMNEMRWLTQALGFLDEQQIKYEAGLKEKQWRELIQGTLSYMEEDLLLPTSGGFVPVSIQLEGIDSVKCKKLIADAQLPGDLPGEAIPMHAGELVVVYWSCGSGEEWESRIRSQLERAARLAPRPFRYTAGIGSAADRLGDVHWSVAEAQRAGRYGFLHEDNVCISYAQVRHRELTHPELKPESFETLLRSGQREEIAAYLHECERELRDGEYAIEAIELALMQLHVYASKAQMLLDVEENAGAPTAYVRKGSLGASFETLRQWAEVLYEQRSEKRNERYQRILSGIKTYVERNIEQDISLEQLSEMTSYSKQFICKLFKEELNTTFVDYLTQLRLDTAALQLTATNDTVARIAARCGFRSSQYFSTKFKMKFGVTPVQYRQAHGDIQILYTGFKSYNG